MLCISVNISRARLNVSCARVRTSYARHKVCCAHVPLGALYQVAPSIIVPITREVICCKILRNCRLLKGTLIMGIAEDLTATNAPFLHIPIKKTTNKGHLDMERQNLFYYYQRWKEKSCLSLPLVNGATTALITQPLLQ